MGSGVQVGGIGVEVGSSVDVSDGDGVRDGSAVNISVGVECAKLAVGVGVSTDGVSVEGGVVILGALHAPNMSARHTNAMHNFWAVEFGFINSFFNLFYRRLMCTL